MPAVDTPVSWGFGSGDVGRGRLLLASISQAYHCPHVNPFTTLDVSTGKGSCHLTAHASRWCWASTTPGKQDPTHFRFKLACNDATQQSAWSQQLTLLQEEANSLTRYVASQVSAHVAGPLETISAALSSAQTVRKHLPLTQLRLPWLPPAETAAEIHHDEHHTQDAKLLALQRFQKGLQLQAIPDPAAAVAEFAAAAELEPDNPLHYSYWSKQLSDSCYQGERSEAKTKEVNTSALDVAVRCHDLPGGPHSVCLVAECVAKGRLALVVDARSRVKLAVSAHAAAIRAISADPSYDVAHHLLGRWHWEMARQNMFVRMLVKLLFNTDLPPGTEAEAADCFRRAAELRPDRLIHRVELARCLFGLGHRDEALQQLKAAYELECEDINAVLCKEEIPGMVKRYSQEQHGWFHFR